MSRFLLILLAGCLAALCSCAKLPRQFASVNSSQRAARNDPSRININEASPDELEKLPGIGAVLAERIVAHREQYGPFRRSEHLMMVRGISDKKFREIQSLLAVE